MREGLPPDAGLKNAAGPAPSQINVPSPPFRDVVTQSLSRIAHRPLYARQLCMLALCILYSAQDALLQSATRITQAQALAAATSTSALGKNPPRLPKLGTIPSGWWWIQPRGKREPVDNSQTNRDERRDSDTHADTHTQAQTHHDIHNQGRAGATAEACKEAHTLIIHMSKSSLPRETGLSALRQALSQSRSQYPHARARTMSRVAHLGRSRPHVSASRRFD